jgi:hypothetical protein
MPTLVPLDPQNLPGGEVEALTSHICGLAREHSVPTAVLVSYIAFGVTGQRRYLRRPDELYSINGHADYAQLFSEKIRGLGGAPDVALTTCLPWRDWLCPSGHALLHRYRMWCSDCFHEDRAVRRRPYQRLYWCLRPVHSCAKHRRLLTATCPQCAAPQIFLPRLPLMDRCNDCGADLAVDDRPVDEPTPAQMWDAECTLDLIAATHRPGLAPVTSAQFQAFVVKLVGELAGGSCSRLGEATGLGANSLRNWTWGRSQPSFLQAMRFFRSIRCPASALVSGYPLIIDPALIERIDEEPLRAVLAFPKDDVAKVKKKLLALLKSTSAVPLSLKQVASRLGRSVQLLKYRYPEICVQIIAMAAQHRSREAARRQASRERRVQQALEECADSGIYPSDRHLRHVAGIEPSDLRRDNLRTLVRSVRERLRTKETGGRPPRLPAVG